MSGYLNEAFLCKRQCEDVFTEPVPLASKPLDRIERAYYLCRFGHVRQVDSETWMVRSQSGNGEYRVTADRCTCPDFEQYKAICKHQLAGVFLAATLVAIAFRHAQSHQRLDSICSAFRREVSALPAGCRALLKDEYRKALSRIAQAPNWIQPGQQVYTLDEHRAALILYQTDTGWRYRTYFISADWLSFESQASFETRLDAISDGITNLHNAVLDYTVWRQVKGYTFGPRVYV